MSNHILFYPENNLTYFDNLPINSTILLKQKENEKIKFLELLKNAKSDENGNYILDNLHNSYYN